jgi:hypothetical protein
MGALKFVKSEPISLKSHPELDEKWVQERIAEDPSILGLGDIVLKDKERIQPRAGRLDLLLQATDSPRRYEVEVQLGDTDEKHIIRTLEYWDIERKRYPQYDHVAVLVAENVTSRFLNVISLFNNTIPIIAVQMNAFNVNGGVSLLFTTVLNEMERGLVEDDEEVQEVTDRAYWENRSSKDNVAIADSMLDMIKGFAPGLSLKYTKFYIGLADHGKPNLFAIFRPQKRGCRVEIRIPHSDETTNRIEESGLPLMDYDSRWKRYRIPLQSNDLKKHSDILRKLLLEAFQLTK